MWTVIKARTDCPWKTRPGSLSRVSSYDEVRPRDPLWSFLVVLNPFQPSSIDIVLGFHDVRSTQRILS